MDRIMLHRAYEELAVHQPLWMSCASFQLDDESTFVLVLSTADPDRVRELPRLCEYLKQLEDRCEGEPLVGPFDHSTLDALAAVQLAHWNPFRKTWSLPGDGVAHKRA